MKRETHQILRRTAGQQDSSTAAQQHSSTASEGQHEATSLAEQWAQADVRRIGIQPIPAYMARGEHHVSQHSWTSLMLTDAVCGLDALRGRSVLVALSTREQNHS
jgi:hypothetical protein